MPAVDEEATASIDKAEQALLDTETSEGLIPQSSKKKKKHTGAIRPQPVPQAEEEEDPEEIRRKIDFANESRKEIGVEELAQWLLKTPLTKRAQVGS